MEFISVNSIFQKEELSLHQEKWPHCCYNQKTFANNHLVKENNMFKQQNMVFLEHLGGVYVRVCGVCEEREREMHLHT